MVAQHARIENDVYPTPAWCVHRLLEEVRLPGGHWVEPAAGDGAIFRAVAEVRNDVFWSALEIRPECERVLAKTASVVIGNAIMRRWDFRPEPIAVVLTNPPYDYAEDFVARALATAPRVAMLLRLDFLGSVRRSRFLRATPPDVHPLPNRPSFVHGKTDRYDYAWFVWLPERRRKRGEVSVLATTPKAVRSAEKRRTPQEVPHVHP
jgi:hypothetical protein